MKEFEIILIIVIICALFLPIHFYIHEYAHAYVAKKYGARTYIIMPTFLIQRKVKFFGIDTYFVRRNTLKEYHERSSGGVTMHDTLDKNIRFLISIAGPSADLIFLLFFIVAKFICFFVVKEKCFRICIQLIFAAMGVLFGLIDWIPSKKEIVVASEIVKNALPGQEVKVNFKDGTKIWYRKKVEDIIEEMTQKGLKGSDYETYLEWVNEVIK